MPLWKSGEIMKYSELHRKLRKAGCYQISTNRHPWWFSPLTGEKFETSHHDSEEVAIGTLRKICKLAGINL
ncbi:MAG: type II toxin-antitoxin system HicA family toxin [Candidatus Cryptobacteroides sp.]